MATPEEILAKSKELFDAGDVEGAKRLARIAKDRMGSSAKPAQSDAMKAGLADLSAMSKDPAASLSTETARNRTVGQALYDNIIGDANDGVDSYGEQIGRSLNDVGRATGAGLVRGATGLVDLPTNITEMYSKGVTAGLEKAGIMSPETARMTQESMMAAIPGGGRKLTEGVSAATGGATDFRGDTTAGKYASTIAEFLPGAAALGGINPSSLLKYGVAPGAASEAAGQATEGTSWEGPARLAGALLGGIGPDLIAKGARAIVSPYGGADPERLKLASVLDDFGVPISAGQRVGNEALRRKEGLTGAGQRLAGDQAEAFTAAALKTAGIEAKRATPEVLDEAATRIGAVFDDVTRGVDVTPDPNSVTKLSEAVATYKRLAAKSEQAPALGGIFKDVVNAFRGGNTISANTLKVWRSDMSKLTTSPSAATREAAIMAREAIDDMVEAALTAAGRAGDIARLAAARSEWRNFLAIQKAAVREGDGLLSPARLRAAVIGQGEAAYARGQRGDIGALSRAGAEVMDTLPNSGTPAGFRAMIPGGSVPGALAAILASSSGAGPLAIGAATLGGLALPGISGAIRMSGPMQAYLANQMANPAVTNMTAGVGSALVPFAERNALATRP